MNSPDKIAILIKKLSLEIDKLSNSVLEPHDLTSSQFKILKYLLHQPEGELVRQVDIEHYFSMTNPTVTGLVQTLEKKGLIERRINPKDSRSKILCPSEKALNMKAMLYKLGEELEGNLTKVLDHEEKQELLRLLNKLLRRQS